jgi:hypothetical protein
MGVSEIDVAHRHPSKSFFNSLLVGGGASRGAGRKPVTPSADVVIVGAGYTGLAAAIRLARSGRSVQVFDKQHPRRGSIAARMPETANQMPAPIENELAEEFSSAPATGVERSRTYSYAQQVEDELRNQCHHNTGQDRPPGNPIQQNRAGILRRCNRANVGSIGIAATAGRIRLGDLRHSGTPTNCGVRGACGGPAN